MKKFRELLFAILFSLVLCGYSFADEPKKTTQEQEDFVFGFDTGILGVGISYGTGNTFVFDLNANLANLYFKNTATGLGMEFYPFNYSYSTNTNEHTLSFSKLYLYWSLEKMLGLDKILERGSDTLIFGPFFSIQTLNLINFENFNTNISYHAGIKLARKQPIEIKKIRMSYASTNMELGYNYFNNRHSVYFTIGFSPGYTLIIPVAYIILAIIGIGD
jgi:hypothetical protein